MPGLALASWSGFPAHCAAKGGGGVSLCSQQLLTTDGSVAGGALLSDLTGWEGFVSWVIPSVSFSPGCPGWGVSRDGIPSGNRPSCHRVGEEPHCVPRAASVGTALRCPTGSGPGPGFPFVGSD